MNLNPIIKQKKDSRWIQAMEEELKALELNNTWILTPLPKEKKAIASE